jgi:hypothetical protein
VIVVQEVWRDRLWAARPVTVVEDRGEALIVWCPKGTVRKVPITPPTRPKPQSRPEWFADLLGRCDWDLADSTWDVSTLWVLREGEWHSVWLSFLDTGEHVGWYVNLQKPFRRTPRGIETMDLMLDVLVDRDRSWRWKDTDDFELLVDRQLLDAAIAAEVRRRAVEVIQHAEQGEFPFDSTLTHWRPHHAWPTPRLPDDWAVLEQVGDAPSAEA